MTNNDWVCDEHIVPMHHHSGDDRRDFLLDVSGPEPRPVGVAEANHLARSRSQVAELTTCCPDEIADEGPRFAGRFMPSRRGLLKSGAVGLGAMMASSAMPRMAFAADPSGPGARDVLVCIFLRGGMDGLSALVPAGDPDYYRARPNLSVKSEQGLIALDSFWAMHPQMESMKWLWDNGELAAVHATGNTDPTRSHFAGEYSMERAAGFDSKAAAVSSGWLGRHLATSATTQGTFRAITLGNRTVTSLATSFPTLAFSKISDFDLWAWEGVKPTVLDGIKKMYATSAGGPAGDAAAKTLAAIGGLADLRATTDGYVPANGAVYPDTRFGEGLAEIAQMIKAGKGLEVACIDIGDWDMHADLGQASDPESWFARKIRELSDGIEAFRTDLGTSWTNTCVLTMSEFGRRVQENNSGGLDHGHGNVMFVAGGQVNGGRVYGSWPGLASAKLDAGDVAITTDYRTVLSELVSKRLKNPNLATVFPGFTAPSQLGIFA